MENINENIAADTAEKNYVKQVHAYSETHGTGVMSSIMFVILAVIFMSILASYIH
ncbi:hypothetical protein J6E39_05275 [bacterium]|nr:hypothetical protein [bacterium]